jgi:heme/copper-type cytochrome/quinol oxidase subunit 3
VLADGRETFATTPLDAEPAAIMRMPEDTYVPLLLAISLGVIAYGLLFSLLWLAALGAVGTAACAITWLWPEPDLAFAGTTRTDFGELPIGASGRRSVGWWGMVAVVATEGAFFAYLLFSYFYLASVATNPWPTDIPHLALPILNTCILVVSSLFVWWGERGIIGGNGTRLRIGYGVAIALGVTFLILQGVEYSREHVSGTHDAYGSLFYTITGFHGAHVFVGLIMLVVVLVRAFRNDFSAPRHEAVSNVAIYWHFVDVVWLAVFTSLYVTPRLL